MALGDIIARLAVSLEMDTVAFEKGATLIEKRHAAMTRNIEKFGKKMTDIGETMSVAVTAPIVAFGYSAVKAAQESAEAMGQVEAALKSMGDGAGRTAEQLAALASKQMRRSLYDDDEILRKVTANLLTFGNVAEEQFDRAQQAAIDIAARMGTDLQSAAIMVGKALNEPAKGLAALRRVGIQFTEQQQEQIKTMTEAGNVAGAQAIMLAELERQFTGSAQAMRDADPMAAAKMQFAELQEEIGAKLVPALTRLAEFTLKVLDAFDELSPRTKDLIIAAAGVAAAIGPVLLILGGITQIAAPALAFFRVLAGLMWGTGTAAGAASVATAGLGSVIGSVAAVALPIAGIALAGYLAWKNWDDLAPRFQPLIDQLTAIGEGLGVVEMKAGATSAELEKNKGWRWLGEQIRLADRDMQTFIGTLDQASIAFGEWWSSSYEAWAQSQAARSRELWRNLKDGAIQAMRDLYDGAKRWLMDGLDKVFEHLRSKLGIMGDLFYLLYKRVVGNSYIPDMVDGIAAEMARLDAVMVAPIVKATAKAQQAFREMAQEARMIMERLFPEAAAQIRYQTERAALVGVGASDAALRALANERDLARQPERSDLAWMSGVGPIANTEQAMRNLEAAMDSLAKKGKVTTVQIAESFKDMAEKTTRALSNLANAIKGGGFLGILEAVIGVGLQLGGMGAFGKSIQTRINAPAYAGGTSNAARGWGLVGERGPELVQFRGGERVHSNRASRAMMGGGQLEIRPSPLFDVYLDGKLVQAAPAIINGGADMAGVRLARSKKWGLLRD